MRTVAVKPFNIQQGRLLSNETLERDNREETTKHQPHELFSRLSASV